MRNIFPLRLKSRLIPWKKEISCLNFQFQLLTKAWNSIPDENVTNFFKKSGISEKSMEKTLNDENDPFITSLDVEEDVMKTLKDDIEMMKEKFHENYGMTDEELVNIDFQISVTSTSSDADIAEVSGHADIHDGEESDVEEQPTDYISKPAFMNVMNARTVLED